MAAVLLSSFHALVYNYTEMLCNIQLRVLAI